MRKISPGSPLALIKNLTLIAGLSFGGLIACTTDSSSKSGSADDYDGTADSMDSLPDCIPELAGSSFWVREKKGAFDCMSSGEWKNRRSAKVPDDAEEEPGAWTPRSIEK